MKGIIRTIKQWFCKHEMKKIKEYNFKVTNNRYCTDISTQTTEIYKCNKCGKILCIKLKNKPTFFTTKYGDYVYGKRYNKRY